MLVGIPAWLRSVPDSWIVVTGTTDNSERGRGAALAKDRARAVRDFLMKSGVAASRIRIDENGAPQHEGAGEAGKRAAWAHWQMTKTTFARAFGNTLC